MRTPRISCPPPGSVFQGRALTRLQDGVLQLDKLEGSPLLVGQTPTVAC